MNYTAALSAALARIVARIDRRCAEQQADTYRIGSGHRRALGQRWQRHWKRREQEKRNECR